MNMTVLLQPIPYLIEKGYKKYHKEINVDKLTKKQKFFIEECKILYQQTIEDGRCYDEE